MFPNEPMFPGSGQFPKPQPQKGWVCPVCGKGCAPWIPYCDCKREGGTE